MVFYFSVVTVSPQKSDLEELQEIIKSVEEFKLVDYEEYPLGRYVTELEKQDADFASAQLTALGKLKRDNLSETELISWELLRSHLNRVDEFKYEMFLNPIQADQGFHLNLNYRVKPILSYSDAIRYLNTLNAIPQFVDEHLILLSEGLKKGLSPSNPK